MSPSARAILASWSVPLWPTFLTSVTAIVYIRGWRTLSCITPGVFSRRRLAAFLAGLGVLWLALASPIDAFDPFLLADHMLQHLVLMVVAPPLILLGAPALPLLHGLPRWAVRDGLGPFLSWPPLGRFGHILTHPAVCWLLMAVAMLGWHVPAAYELALRSPGWHDLEHACFFVTSILFWWPVIRPWPSRPHWPLWIIPLYLLFGDFVNSALSAFLAFCDRVLYPTYLSVPRLFGVSALNDQVAAGAIMWVIGSFAFVVPAVIVTVRLLSPRPTLTHTKRTPPPLLSPMLSPDLDVLGASERGSGSFRHGHRAAEAVLIALVLAAIAYGVFAPADLDDGGVVSVNEPSGPFRITVFTAPASPRCGPVGVSVLVQDLASDQAILDATVDVALQSRDGTAGTAIRARATQEESTNKLLQTATLDVPAPGAWQLRVSVHRGRGEGAVGAGLEIAPQAIALASLWPYLLLLLSCTGVLALHHALRRDARRPTPPSPEQLLPVKQA